MSKKRQLPDLLSNLLHRWFKRFNIIPLLSFLTFNFSAKYKFHQLFEMKIAPEKQTDPIEEYAEDIHRFHKLVEGESRPHNYFSSYSRITPRVRASLVNLIVEVHQKLHLSPETLYLTVSIFDRFLSQESVERVEAKLVGMCAMHIASKYEEVYKPLYHLIHTGDYLGLMKFQIKSEHQGFTTGVTLKALNHIYLTKGHGNSFPSLLYCSFLSLLMSVFSKKLLETECMIFFFSELALTQHFLIEMFPSLLAASCVYAARCTLKKNPLWTKTLQHCTRYSEPQLIECAQILRYAHSQAPKSIMNVVYNKYSHERFQKVALYAPAEVEAWNN